MLPEEADQLPLRSVRSVRSMVNLVLNVVTMIFCASVILYYLWAIEHTPKEIETGDVLFAIWACLKMLEIVVKW